jgi:hypothetical protein
VLPLALPVVAVAAVALAVLVLGRPLPAVGVRVRGGPTAGARSVSFRLEVAERLGDLEQSVPGRRVSIDALRGNGERISWRGMLDSEGAAVVSFGPRAVRDDGSVHMVARLGDEGPPIAEGSFALSVDAWSSRARRRGGWVERRFEDGITLRAAAERGVFAVPFAGGLWVEARRNGNSLGPIDVRGDGADLASPAEVAPGRVRYLVTPREHAVAVALSTRTTPRVELDVALAVAPGALLAELSGNVLVVRSPVPRERAYVAVVTEQERIGGGTVHLSPDATGGARGELGDIPLPENTPLWAVVSSEPELRSGSLVGWPLRVAPGGEPPKTFDVPDALLLDTMKEAVERELGRTRRIRLLAALIAVSALAGTAAAVAARARRAQTDLTAHLAGAGADEDATRRVAATGGASAWLVVAAVLSVVLAALLFALFAVAR